MTELDHATARAYWKALLDNASRLIADARLLLEHESAGRARSLTILAEEELGKALTVYEVFSRGWSEDVSGVASLPTAGSRDHLAKYRAAFEFGQELERFWGRGYDDYPADDDWGRWFEQRRAAADTAARAANAAKQRGLYVDLTAGKIATPAEITAEGTADELMRAAQVIEMMLIQDHTRMQATQRGPDDDTYEQQWRVMPFAHPQEFADFAERVVAKTETDTVEPNSASGE